MESRELDKKIAELLGWSDFKEVGYFVEGYGIYEPVEDIEGLPPVGERRLVPHYSTSLDDALTLWNTLSEDYTPILVRILSPMDDKITFRYRASILDNESMESVECEGQNAAMVITQCWLNFKIMKHSRADLPRDNYPYHG